MTRQQQDFSTQNKIDQNKNKERRWWHSVRLFVRGHIRETTNAKRQSKLHESTFNYWVHCIGMQCIWIPRRPSLPQHTTHNHHHYGLSSWYNIQHLAEHHTFTQINEWRMYDGRESNTTYATAPASPTTLKSDTQQQLSLYRHFLSLFSTHTHKLSRDSSQHFSRISVKCNRQQTKHPSLDNRMTRTHMFPPKPAT